MENGVMIKIQRTITKYVYVIHRDGATNQRNHGHPAPRTRCGRFLCPRYCRRQECAGI